MTVQTAIPHEGETHESSHQSTLNWLRAGVLGANDGIVSVAAIVMGVIAAGQSNTVIATTGLAATVAGAVSMALGEYVSVSAQRDTEQALIAKERHELTHLPREEHAEMVAILQGYGVSAATAEQAVTEIEQGDPLDVHLQLELGIDPEELTSPLVAAFSSAGAFTVGAALPLLAVLVSPQSIAAVVLLAVTLLTLALTGAISAGVSKTSRLRSMLRLVLGGAAGLAVTYGVGLLIGTSL
ncbi:VIT1/CCC1 transporter family protein [Corynebacterium choanae]|uniref:VIT family protein n=1 Tax=Corynebacterium choanae TaxID=1862358 RepID=A0A3G6JCM0_9CORY|nr:VIT family protein [Corynebacterium choanae]AZA13904.1 VIT family protein [Corynebacterium choanae]